MLRALGKPIRIVFFWQLAATAAMALAAAWLSGPEAAAHAALSATAGGTVSILAGLAAALVASLSKAKSAGGFYTAP